MKVSGFTIARNAILYGYPIIESIRSVLPVCDEFIVNLGDSDDDTGQLIRSINDPRIRIIENKWDFSKGPEVLSYQTNLALKECRGDWAFYAQSDEVVHEHDLAKVKAAMHRYLKDDSVDALRFKWFHFYGSYHRYRVDAGWYQKQDRIIRNNGTVESFGDAFAFRRTDGRPLRVQPTGAFIYHYGWVQSPQVMAQRRANAARIGFIKEEDGKASGGCYNYGDLNRFPIYFGSHPKVMDSWVEHHDVSRADLGMIRRKYWWHPARYLKLRYKTSRRVSRPIA